MAVTTMVDKTYGMTITGITKRRPGILPLTSSASVRPIPTSLAVARTAKTMVFQVAMRKKRCEKSST